MIVGPCWKANLKRLGSLPARQSGLATTIMIVLLIYSSNKIRIATKI